MRILCLILLASSPAWAQPRDCGTPGPGIPLQLDLNSLPGSASRSVQGSAMVMVPSTAPTPCAKPPHLPSDVLHGDPGDALRGDASSDPLSGAPTSR